MWLFTTVGFFSIVQKPRTSFLTVRARVASDLDNLRKQFMPTLSATTKKGGTDYPYRATISHANFAAGLAKLGSAIDYGNFKSEVARRMGAEREHVYSRVWKALLALESETPMQARPAEAAACTSKTGLRKAYGGVLINQKGEVLLREPTNHFDGYVWTFAKGKPDPGESPEQTALREVLEETGIRAQIMAPIPGSYNGSRTSNEYFLMRPLEDTGHFHWETAAVKWVTVQEARKLIWLTQKPNGRARDLRLLEAAFALYASEHGTRK